PEWTAALERDRGEETYQVRQALHDAIAARRHTEQRLAASLREKEVLLQEVHHRVKNNLQVISSMLSLQRDTVSDAGARQALEDSGQRVLSMALVHELLYQGSSADTVQIDEYLHNLTGAIPLPAGGGVTISVDAPATPVTIDAAIPTGLIVTELITNAVKHAFVGNTQGVIAVCATAEGDGALRVMVADNGIGLPQGWSVDVTDSLGMRIITALVSQLHTSLTVGDENRTPPGIAAPRDTTQSSGVHEASGIGPGTRFSFVIPTAENPTSGGAREGEFVSHRSDSPLHASRAEAEGAPKLRSLK
ncbi:MAG TPA: sensor histidine kinase, partial [Alkalispirochaeta sp.]|nr:sensor histidine kinase [Alkalispirochaeta sp.]